MTSTRKIIYSRALCLSLTLLILLAGQIVHADENPLAYHPLLASPDDRKQASDGLTRFFLFSLSVYSNNISRVDGNRCPSYPSCSLYARNALHRHGAIPGMWLTVDRLIHEHTEIHRHDRIRLPDGSLRVPDTLNTNDFWFYKNYRENP